MRDKLKEMIKRHEGFRAKPYLDTLGIPTFGYGFTYIRRDEAECILENRINYILKALHRVLPFFDDLDEARQIALADMAYQLGIGGLLKFRKMLKALEAGQYETAYREALNSRWARQTPVRAREIANILRTGRTSNGGQTENGDRGF